MSNNLFTKEEKKAAKRDHKELRKMNPEGFIQIRNQMRSALIDGLSKFRIRFDLKQVLLFR